MKIQKPIAWATLAALAAGALAGCATGAPLSPDLGVALKQDLAAQIADPDARYVGDPAPGSNSERVELAQRRYVRGQVISPSAVSASGFGAATATPSAPPLQ